MKLLCVVSATAFLLLSAFVPTSAFAPPLKKFSHVAESLVGITTAREKKMTEALELLVAVMNDKDFQEDIKKLKFRSDRSDDPNRELSTRQVVNKIYKGKERYKQIADSVANIYWVAKKKNKPVGDSSPTIGYTTSGIKTIYTYSWALDQYEIPNITGHIAHEWSHKLGFMHRKKKHPYRKKTVPYAFGYLIGKHAARLKGVTFLEEDEYEFECGYTNSTL